MPPKADNPASPLQPSAAGASGKLVIIGIMAVALAAAVGSWWFRYNATHRAAIFWGPKAATLIRDAPQVTFFYRVSIEDNLDNPDLLKNFTLPNASGEVDVSNAHGLAHLRNALLEDQSFSWGSSPKVRPRVRWMLRFRDPTTNEEASLVFDESGKYCILLGESDSSSFISCEPIANGLNEMFLPFEAVPPIVPPEYR